MCSYVVMAFDVEIELGSLVYKLCKPLVGTSLKPCHLTSLLSCYVLWYLRNLFEPSICILSPFFLPYIFLDIFISVMLSLLTISLNVIYHIIDDFPHLQKVHYLVFILIIQRFWELLSR